MLGHLLIVIQGTDGAHGRASVSADPLLAVALPSKAAAHPAPAPDCCSSSGVGVSRVVTQTLAGTGERNSHGGGGGAVPVDAEEGRDLLD